MISGFKASIQNELNAFFANLANQADLVRQASAQAFSKARQGFSAVAFTRLNDRLLELVNTHMAVPRWHGLRVVAADASKMQLFLQDVTRRCVREVIALALHSPDIGEREMLLDHLGKLDARDLLVLDRGYPARWLMAYLTQRCIHFCVRVDVVGFAVVKRFLQSGPSEQIVSLGAPDQKDCNAYGCERTPTQVRLVRVVTPNGRIHVVMTSLLDAVAYPATDFVDLYHSRWRIEEAFKRLKHRLALENTSGLSLLAAQQDFAAKILADNLDALTVKEAAEQSNISNNYKVNRTYAFAHLKRCLPRWILDALPGTTQILSTLAELARNLIRFLPGASKPRPEHPKPHQKQAYKSTT